MRDAALADDIPYPPEGEAERVTCDMPLPIYVVKVKIRPVP